MNICLVGAGGGIGRQLLKTLATKHDVRAVYRTLPPGAGTNAVAFNDEAGLSEAVQSAQVVIHAALNTKARGKQFIPANQMVTERLLELIEVGRCRLFVYFSSQVVYAALDPVAHPVQSEELDLPQGTHLDAYTRLKLMEEQRVIEACTAKGIDYLIVRPTVVMGPHMQWSSGIVDAMRWAPVGLGKRIFNLVHVEDLSAQLLALIDREVANETVNLGDYDVPSDVYFRHAASLAGRPVLLAPNWLARAARPMIPSTLWFLGHEVKVGTDKVKRLTGITTNRSLADFFEPAARVVNARELVEVQAVASGNRPFHTIGRGYHLWFNDRLASDQLVMEHYTGILGMVDGALTVRAGTTLRQVLDYLTPRGLTLGTLPEFVDISAGACFFAEVHGSSNDFISVYDLISAIRYVGPDGQELHLPRDNAQWDKLRADPAIVVTEVTFDCIANRDLANVIEWHPDDRLEHFVDGGYKANFSTTVHWYPRSREMMVYNVNPVDQRHPKDRGPFAPMRGSPALIQKILLTLRLRGRLRIVGSSEQVLAPWTTVPAKRLLGRWFRRGHRRLRNLEICVPDSSATAFFARLRAGLPTMQVNPGQGIGVRFTHQPETGRGFVWVEMTSRNTEQLHAMIEMARAVCGENFWLHRGKYVPAWMAVRHLFIPRHTGHQSDLTAGFSGGQVTRDK